jgi:hypothetical protein
MTVQTIRRQSSDGVAELELRFNGGFGGEAGTAVVGRALGRSWPDRWRIRTLLREGDAAVLILRRVRPAGAEEAHS